MESGSSIQEDVEAYKADIQTLEREIRLKEQMIRSLKKTNEVIEKRQNLNKKRILDLEKKVRQLEQERDRASSYCKSITIQPQHQNRQIELQRILNENSSLLKKVEDLKKEHNSQIEKMRSELDSRIYALNKAQSAISQLKEKQVQDIPEELPQASKIVSKDEETNKKSVTADVKASVLQKAFIKKRQIKPQPKQPQQRFSSLPDSHILIEKRLRRSNNEYEGEDSMRIVSQSPKKFDIDDDDFQAPQIVAPLNKKIMHAVMEHYEAIKAEKKWPFLNMLCAWAETKMEGICENLAQIQYD